MHRIGLIGCGIFGGRHLDGLAEIADRVRLVGTADTDLDRARQAAERGGATMAVDDFRELLPHVDAVIVATPHQFHHPIGMAALAAGKHVFVEKPLALSEQHGEELIAAADEAKRLLMTGYVMRFHPLVARMKRAIDDGEYGEPVHASFHTEMYLDRPGWRSAPEARGGGGLFSHGCHYVDLMLWFLGEPVRGTHVGTRFGTPWEVAGETTDHALVEFASGSIGHYFTTEVSRRPKGRSLITVHCTEGVLDARLSDGELHASTRDGRDELLLTATPGPKYTGVEVAHFLDCIENGTRPLTDGRRSLQSLRVIWRLYDAASCGAVADLRGLGLDNEKEPA